MSNAKFKLLLQTEDNFVVVKERLLPSRRKRFETWLLQWALLASFSLLVAHIASELVRVDTSVSSPESTTL